jgi:YgiT-type zinc finger domain-containing protein
MSRPERLISPAEVRNVVEWRGGMGRGLPAEENEMKCIHCQGGMRRGAAPFHVDRKGYYPLFDTVPAWVCSQCGEAYFEEPKVDSIQEAIRALDTQATKLTTSA